MKEEEGWKKCISRLINSEGVSSNNEANRERVEPKTVLFLLRGKTFYSRFCDSGILQTIDGFLIISAAALELESQFLFESCHVELEAMQSAD